MKRNNTKILIAEAEEQTAIYILKVLLRFGYNVSSITSTSEETIQKAVEDNADVVIMDAKLWGEFNAFDAAKELINEYKIPVIFLLTSGNEEMLEQTLEAGINRFLYKPFDPIDLNILLEEIVAERKIINAS